MPYRTPTAHSGATRPLRQVNGLTGALALALLLLSLGVACVSPEAARKRDGGSGADPGNWTKSGVDLHSNENIYQHTPRVPSPGYR